MVDATADVMAPTAQISRPATSAGFTAAMLCANYINGSVTLQRGDVRDDAADEQYHAPCDLPVGFTTRGREDQVE